MSDEATNLKYLAARQEDVATLARETDTPIETVAQIYSVEHAKLDRAARIKTYVPVLTRRHVKEVLQTLRLSA